MADDARPKLLAPAGFGGADSDPDQVPARRASVEFFSSTLGVLSSGETDMDAFISHSSEDSEIAARVAKALKAEEVDVWLDLSSIRAGQLLGADLLEHIRECDSLVLLWSESASDSEWVNTEWLMAVNERKFLVPCVLDDTRPPQCMETVTSVDFRKGWERGVIELRRSIQEGRGQGPTTTPVMVSTSRDCRRDADRIKAAQSEVLGCLMRRDLKGAEEKSATAGRMLAEARAAWKFDPMIQYNLRGYHCKNEFVWRNWDAINGGQAPAHDPILKEARGCFIRWLWVDPFDPYALNGVGNVLFYSRHLRAAACFTGWALSMVDRRGVPTDVRLAFEHDRDTMARFIKMSDAQSRAS